MSRHHLETIQKELFLAIDKNISFAYSANALYTSSLGGRMKEWLVTWYMPLCVVGLFIFLAQYYSLWSFYQLSGHEPELERALPKFLQRAQRMERLCFMSLAFMTTFTVYQLLERTLEGKDVSVAIFSLCYWLVIRRQQNYLKGWQRYYAKRKNE